jgi:hypothetical protein
MSETLLLLRDEDTVETVFLSGSNEPSVRMTCADPVPWRQKMNAARAVT